MAYKLLDQNGNKMIINGMNKGYIKVPYNYQGMELYNENYISDSKSPFFSAWFGSGSRRVKIGSSYYYSSTTTKKYVGEAYGATEITITGKYSDSAYKDYEVYRDGNLVASGSYTNSQTDIYVCQKEANTSIVVSGIWDDTNSKFIYNITTNAIITRENSYQWFNPMHTGTINITVGEGQDYTTTQYYNRIVMPSLNGIKSKVASKIGTSSNFINVTKVELDSSTLYWYNDYYSSQSPYFSLSTSSPSYFGGGISQNSTGRYVWGTSNLDITSKLSSSSTTFFYGYRETNDIYNTFSDSSSSGSRFCTSSSSSTVPTFTLIVTYEY